jgi:predicted transcriptional regulator
VLWQKNQASVREIHDEIGEAHDWAYSTTKTLLDRMVKKGYLERRDLHGAFVYRPRLSRALGLARRVQEFADRVLEADYGSVVALFARAQSLTPSEIEELEKLLEGGEE